MDQKNQGHQRPGTPQQSGQQHTHPDEPATQNPNREQMPGQPGSQREQTRGTQSQGGRMPSEKGRGSQGERNQGEGISNRGLDRELEEQRELPNRGSSQADPSDSDG